MYIISPVLTESCVAVFARFLGYLFFFFNVLLDSCGSRGMWLAFDAAADVFVSSVVCKVCI